MNINLQEETDANNSDHVISIENTFINKVDELELTEKYLENNYTFSELADDDILRDTLHYVKKYYKIINLMLLISQRLG